MPNHSDEISRRETAARAAINSALAKEGDDSGVALFVSHHLAELGPSYWKKHLATETPNSKLVLDLLELKSHWGGNDEIENFDFTLPGEVTDYIICVRFGDDGSVSEVVMES